MADRVPAGAFQVLWLGDPRAVNQGSWSAGDGLAYATSQDGAPDTRWLWNAADPGPAATLVDAVNLARTGRTDQLGALVAPAGVRYIAVVTALAPVIPGEQDPTPYPVPADLAPGLARQLDLQTVLSQDGLTVYENTDWYPQRALVPATSRAGTGDTSTPDPLFTLPGAPVVGGAAPVLPGPAAATAYHGPVAPGVVLAAVAPAGDWELTVGQGPAVPRSSSYGWGARYRVARGGQATLSFHGGPWPPLGVLWQIAVWLAALALLVGAAGRRSSTGRLSRRPRGVERSGG